MTRIRILIVLLVATMAFSVTMRADTDPFFNEVVGNSCPANCASSGLANDPLWLNGPKTVEYIFNSTIPSVIAGDVLINESGVVGDVIRFEDIPSVGAVAFIYSDDIATGLAADVGIPPTFQTTTLSLTEGVNYIGGTNVAGQTVFTPTSTEPGYCPNCNLNGVHFNPTYGLQSNDVPEPSSVLLLGGSLLAWLRVRKRRS